MKHIVLVLFVSAFALASASADGPVHEAIRSGSLDQLTAAVEGGADINVRGPGGQTPVMHATLKGDIEAVRYLLSKGADVTIGEGQGYTPIHGAAFRGRPEIAKLLIEHGMDPSDRHKDGFTPIHRACWGSEKTHTKVVKVLLEAGVPYDLLSGDGKTPLEVVQNNPGTKKLLKKWKKKDERQKKAAEEGSADEL